MEQQSIVEKRQSKNKPYVLIGTLILVAVIIFFNKEKKDKLYQNYEITEGMIIGYAKGFNTDLAYKIDNYNPEKTPTIQTGGKRFQKRIRRHMDELKGMKFPVIYEKGNIENNEILIYKSQYERTNIKIPDSLKSMVSILSKYHK